MEVLVANAGITSDTAAAADVGRRLPTVVDTNLAGSFRCVRSASQGDDPAAPRPDRADLLVVGLFGSAGQVNYAAQQGGAGRARPSVTRELGSRGITANVVAPGFIETDMTAAAARGPQKTT